MNFFNEAMLRLKQQLHVTEDKQVADALGFTPAAWTKRKKRGSFPETELYALAARRPELGLDVRYILTGEFASARLQAEYKALMSAAEPFGEAMQRTVARVIQSREAAQAARRARYEKLIELLDDCPEDNLALIETLTRSLHDEAMKWRANLKPDGGEAAPVLSAPLSADPL